MQYILIFMAFFIGFMGAIIVRRPNKKSRKKIEFSKIIFIGVTVVTLIIIGASLVIIFITRDTQPLTYLITGTMAEMATATAFYYHKAKIENEIKLKKIYDNLAQNEEHEGQETPAP